MEGGGVSIEREGCEIAVYSEWSVVCRNIGRRVLTLDSRGGTIYNYRTVMQTSLA